MRIGKGKRIWLLLVIVLAGGVVTLAMFSLFSRRPSNLGITNGRLAPCPNTPNCVCTQDADDTHRIEPLAYEGTPREAMARLKAILTAFPRVNIVSESDAYLHAEFTSLIFRFVDDVEFLIDDGRKVIDFRSASRVGRSDLGVNRRRMEAIREKWNRQEAKSAKQEEN
jgi:uncharacterized protein (DUF1499 family)